MISWEFPKPPDLDLKFPGAPKAWLRAIQQRASKEELIDAIYLFGSRLRGTFHEESDLDLANPLSLKPSPDPERPYWRLNHEWVDRELQELIPVETDVNVLHLNDWDDTTKYVREEGLAIYINPSPYPRG